MDIYGIKLIGVNTHTGEKLLFTLVLIVIFYVLRIALKGLTGLVFSRYQPVRRRRARALARGGRELGAGLPDL
jgi:hypothetical protein